MPRPRQRCLLSPFSLHVSLTSCPHPPQAEPTLRVKAVPVNVDKMTSMGPAFPLCKGLNRKITEGTKNSAQ